jgi:aminoglycoside phosphotransferase (APT) family kinase protein
MSERATWKILGTNLREHPAVRAWSELRPAQVEPQAIWTQKERKKSAVYRLEGVGSGGSAVIAKRCKRETALLEGTIYKEILPHLPIPVVHYYGLVEEPNSEYSWLFLEDVGDDQYSPLIDEHRALAAHWLARMHTAASRASFAPCLPDCGPTVFLEHLHEACGNIRGQLGNSVLGADDAGVLRDIVSQCDLLEYGWEHVENQCARMPPTLVHGDFGPKNLRVRSGVGGLTVFPFDWETAGWGVPAADLFAVDMSAYWSVARTSWPDLDLPALERQAKIGRIFRSLAAIHWASTCLGSPAFERAMSHIRCFQSELADAIRSVRWRTQTSSARAAQAPGRDALTAGLAMVLCGDGRACVPPTIVDRRINPHASTFPSEVVTCRRRDGAELRVLCKYEADSHQDTLGHRGGPAYEAEVYRRVLQPARASTPRFYGSCPGRTPGETWLFIEYVTDGVRADEAPSPAAALESAAGWVGRFHAAAAARLARERLPFLQTYDGAYYRQWAGRTAQFAGRWHERLPWLAPLCERFAEVAAALSGQEPTVIHGEYTPHNVLLRGEQVVPVDWESAAVAPGEIDLASLTEGWPDEVVQSCRRAYQQARWPGGGPADFDQRLDRARLYWALRWLGHQPEWYPSRKLLARFEQLRATGERLGLVPAGAPS